jgi:UDP-N-acetylglucosamine 2-epimerase (non-hydrolysing)
VRRDILVVFGTRPEAIKLCPVVLHLGRFPEAYRVRVCVTAQHRHMLDQVLSAFHVVPDRDLDLMLPGQTLAQSTSRAVAALDPVLEAERPDMVIVQGDTTPTLCGALAAFYRGIPVGHVEAGLRTGDFSQPFPEEMNRVLTTRLAALHLAATEMAAANLCREGVSVTDIAVTGNTVVDAVLHVRDGLESGAMPSPQWPWLDPGKRLILVTTHRRESSGQGLERICEALLALAARPDVRIVCPVHPNPRVQDPLERRLAGHPNIRLIEPQDYVPFVDLMRRAFILITDSGGIQEEGPSLGKPILVLREKTERPEAVQAGTVKLVGTDTQCILANARELLDNPSAYAGMARVHKPLWGWPCQRAHRGRNSFIFQEKKPGGNARERRETGHFRCPGAPGGITLTLPQEEAGAIRW